MSDCSTNAFAIPAGDRLRRGGRYRLAADLVLGRSGSDTCAIPEGTVIGPIGFDDWAGVALVGFMWGGIYRQIDRKSFAAVVVGVGQCSMS